MIIHCTNKSVILNQLNKSDILLELKTGDVNDELKFNIILYSDKYQADIMGNYLVDVRSYEG